MIFNKTSLIAGIVGAAFALSSAAQAGGVPKKTAWTAYGTTSSGYAQAVAIGNMLKSITELTFVLYPVKMISLVWRQ